MKKRLLPLIAVVGVLCCSCSNSTKAEVAEDEGDETTETEISVVTSEETISEETSEEASEETAPDAEESFEPPEVNAGVVAISLDDLPETSQLEAFVSRFDRVGYDCEAGFGPYSLSSFLPNSSMTETFVDYRLYFDDFRIDTVPEDPEGNLVGSLQRYRLDSDYLYWVEENIFNLSEDQMEYLNSSLTDDEYRGDWYLADDGYIYYRKGDAGSGDRHEITDILFDGEYYYTRINTYYFDQLEDYYIYHTLKLKYIENEGFYWSVVGVSDTEPQAFLDFENQEHTEVTEPVVVQENEKYDYIATLPDTGWKGAYVNIVENLTPSAFRNAYLPDNAPILYDLIFINDDEIPELVACADTVNGETYINIYTFVNGEAIQLGDSYYRYTVDVSYVPYENRLHLGGYASGMDMTVEIGRMSDDLMSIELTEVSSYGYDRDVYRSQFEAAAAGADTGDWYYYIWDDASSSSIRITEEEYNDLTSMENAEPVAGGYTDAEFIVLISG